MSEMRIHLMNAMQDSPVVAFIVLMVLALSPIVFLFVLDKLMHGE